MRIQSQNELLAEGDFATPGERRSPRLEPGDSKQWDSSSHNKGGCMTALAWDCTVTSRQRYAEDRSVAIGGTMQPGSYI